jgi:hypothetical protein
MLDSKCARSFLRESAKEVTFSRDLVVYNITGTLKRNHRRVEVRAFSMEMKDAMRSRLHRTEMYYGV